MESEDEERERRQEALEMKSAYQEEEVSKLSGLTWDLTRRMDRLEALVADIRRKLAALEDPSPNPPADQRPPHY